MQCVGEKVYGIASITLVAIAGPDTADAEIAVSHLDIQSALHCLS